MVRRVTWMREALEVVVERVARANLDAALDHPRVEAVERAHWRAAVDLAELTVDTAVARADEAFGCLDVADRAAKVHAAVGDRDERLVRGVAVQLRVVLADVDRRLARVADVGDQVDDLLDVEVLVEVGDRADVLP